MLLRPSGWHNVSGAPTTAQYLYNANGNMNFDPYKGFSTQYNFLNLPTQMTWIDGGTGAEKVISILYDGSGRKLRKTVTDNGALLYKQDYVDGMEYRTTTTVTLSLESIFQGDGRVHNTSVGTASADVLRYEYTIKDHLGNTRLTRCRKMFSNLKHVLVSVCDAKCAVGKSLTFELI